MKKLPVAVVGTLVVFCSALSAAPDPQWLGHDRERPLPAVVTPGTPSTQEQAEIGRASCRERVLFAV